MLGYGAKARGLAGRSISQGQCARIAIILATSTHSPSEASSPGTIDAPAEPTGTPGLGPNCGAFSTTVRRAIARCFVPSISDCFFIALIVWLFVWGASGWISLLGDGDTGWHIRTGQYILAHHSVPTRDLFSFSRPGAPWFAWEWLTDVTYAVLFRIAGLKAIVLMAGFMIALFATVVLRYTVWRGANALVAAVTTMLAVGASSMHFLARPHLLRCFYCRCVCGWWKRTGARRRAGCGSSFR